MALSATAMGKVRLAAAAGQRIPARLGDRCGGTADDRSRCGDQGHAVAGSGTEGFGLAFVIDLLCGGLSDGAVGAEVRPLYGDPRSPIAARTSFWRSTPVTSRWATGFAQRVRDQAARVSGSKRGPGVDRIYAPGELVWATRQRKRERLPPRCPDHEKSGRDRNPCRPRRLRIVAARGKGLPDHAGALRSRGRCDRRHRRRQRHRPGAGMRGRPGRCARRRLRRRRGGHGGSVRCSRDCDPAPRRLRPRAGARDARRGRARFRQDRRPRLRGGDSAEVARSRDGSGGVGSGDADQSFRRRLVLPGGRRRHDRAQVRKHHRVHVRPRATRAGREHQPMPRARRR